MKQPRKASICLQLEQVVPNGRPDLSSLSIDDEYLCEGGDVAVGESCVPCAAGMRYDAPSKSCATCQPGEYQPDEGEARCLRCPDDGVTTGPGAIAADECKRKLQKFMQADENRDNAFPTV